MKNNTERFCDAVGIRQINGKISLIMPCYVLNRLIGVSNNTIDFDIAVKESIAYIEDYERRIANSYKSNMKMSDI